MRWSHIVALAAILLACSQVAMVFGSNGYFFQMTDIHYDPLYVAGSDVGQDCHRGTGAAGTFGNRWNCDAPLRLVSALPKFNGAGSPDFVVWTGDNARHDADFVVPRTANDIYAANAAVASLLKTMNVPLIPSIGNNDVYPHDTLCMGPGDQNLGNLSKIWSTFIPPQQQATFETIGSYAVSVNNGQTIVAALNSMFMFKKNKCDSGCHDGQSGDQVIQWLHSVLKAASSSGQTVYISGHVPPTDEFWHHKCLEKYSALATKYASTIGAHLYAHTHQDNYAILRDADSGQPNAVINIAPSGVSTYNPSVRQYLYNPSSGAITDYVQFYANLTQINQAGSVFWTKEYNWLSAYNYNSWSLANWVDLDHRISTQPGLAARYLNYRYVSSGLTQFLCSSAEAEIGACVLHLDKHHAHP